MDDCGASLLHIPLKSKQGTLYTREGRRNKGGRRKEEKPKKKRKRRNKKDVEQMEELRHKREVGGLVG